MARTPAREVGGQARERGLPEHLAERHAERATEPNERPSRSGGLAPAPRASAHRRATHTPVRVSADQTGFVRRLAAAAAPESTGGGSARRPAGSVARRS